MNKTDENGNKPGGLALHFMRKTILYSLTVLLHHCLSAQDTRMSDTLFRHMDTIRILMKSKSAAMEALPVYNGTYSYIGKKTEMVRLRNLLVNTTDNNPRQVFSKVPGIFIYENDGTGNQVNISARGLTSHRSWEFNVRYNGVMTNSDIYGYPASHFNPPMESVDRIEIVRGSASLQYGAQFGGMVNYLTADADSGTKFSAIFRQSAGSYGLYSTYNAVKGNLGKFTYSAYFNYRRSDGYREQSRYNYLAAHIHLGYQLARYWKITAEYDYMDYLNHINGGLTDQQFAENPRLSTRKRNYYSPAIHLPSLSISGRIWQHTLLQFTSSAVLGQRNSVQFIALNTVPDTINRSTWNYNPRQVDRDYYDSWSHELRLAQGMNIFGQHHQWIAGLRYISNDLHRLQLGQGTTGTDYDLSLVNPQWGRDLHFITRNTSLFLEDDWEIFPRLHVTGGARMESGITHMKGYIKDYPADKVPVDIPHHFVLFGAGMQYTLSEKSKLFVNWAQAYRPVIFADIIPANSLQQIDPSIADARGYNAEAGIQGSNDFFHYQANLFLLRYRNITGNILQTGGNGAQYFLKTNIGDMTSTGAEAYAEMVLTRWQGLMDTKLRSSVYLSGAYTHARYTRGTVPAGGKNTDITGNQVVASPPWIVRAGWLVKYKAFTALVQYSFTDNSYADPLNTVTPDKTGSIGRVPSYQLADLNLGWKFNRWGDIRLSLNNLFDKKYFTERPAFFPGPGGIYPSDGRTIIFSLGCAL